MSIKLNLISNLGTNLWMALISLVFVPYYIRFLGIESYGLIGVFATLQAMTSLLDLGFTTTINREMARLSMRDTNADETRNLVRTLETVYWAIAILIGAIILFLVPFLTNHWITTVGLTRGTVRLSLFLIGIIIVFQWPYSFYAGALLGLQKQVSVGIINAGVATVRGCGAALILGFISPTIQAFFGWQIAITLLSTLLMVSFLWRNLPQSSHAPRFHIIQLRQVIPFSAGVSAVGILGLVLLQMDKVILTKLLTLKNFGYYTLASVVTASLYMLVNPVYNAVFPRITQLVAAKDEAGLVNFYHQSSAAMAVLVLSATAVLAFFSQPIIFAWTGDAETAARTSLLVTLLAIGTGLHGLVHVPWAVQLAHGWTQLGIYQNSVGVLVLVPLIIVLTLHYGAVGGAIAWSVLNIMYVTAGQAVMHRRLLKGELRRWYLNDVGWVALVACAVAGTARYIIPCELPRLWLLVLLMGVSGCTLSVTALATPSVRKNILSGNFSF